MCWDSDLLYAVGAHGHGAGEGLVEAVVHAVDQVRQVVHEVPKERVSKDLGFLFGFDPILLFS